VNLIMFNPKLSMFESSIKQTGIESWPQLARVRHKCVGMGANIRQILAFQNGKIPFSGV